MKGGGYCPFCPGNEDKTPPEITASRPPNSQRDVPGWNIRVVPNKFPALRIESDLRRRAEGNYDVMNGVGAHEVVIETPNHASDFADVSANHMRDVLLMFRDRVLDLKKDVRFQYILIFKNHGVAAGASLEHTHSQLIATPIIPIQVADEIDGGRRFFNYKERCIYCDIILQELKSQIRVVSNSNSYIVIEPFAPRFPYETWILPKQHYSHFETMPETQYTELANTLKETLNRINQTLGYPPYNFILHTSPVQESFLLEYHWHIEIMPKLAKIAGFEWGSGFYINSTPPEIAAEDLRNAV